MIKTFNKRRLLFFPIRWANSVSRWILGVKSSSGTISIRNTANPNESGSIDLNVNVDAIISKVKNELGVNDSDKIGLNQVQRKAIRGIIFGLLNDTMAFEGEHFGINVAWLEKYIEQKVSIGADNDGDGDGINVTNLVLQHLFVQNDYDIYALPITLTIEDGKVTSCSVGTAYDLYTHTSPNTPTVS